ncbi:hydroxymethylbilane synthase [Egicoccus halophilus]|uniref:Porphobilinogen deaminase n=1 Tax=Egicoccus halophilus TaxID=1670830 RepID=A0A8J3A9W1_9ACTN|nr:hydroxymethylbilane synthase [Egicoccus halophilus]GGI05659.1 porphobilinogen deaminase [Egicoccus halophilus]
MASASDRGPWRIATRRSTLAQTQARHVGESLQEATGRPFELVPMATTGDDHPDRALEAFDSKGLFVDSTRRAVLSGDCHLVVHSYKDLPTEPAEGLVIGAVPQRVDPRDALVTRAGHRLAELPRDRQVTIGTSSPRRRAQLQKARRDVLVQPIRGNLETRLGKVVNGEVDGIVLALAGLLRLRPQGFDLTVVPLEHGELLHAPAQGALAIECRVDDATTRKGLRRLDHAPTRTVVAAERELLLQLQGGCTAPIGAHASLLPGPDGGERLELLGLLSDPSGTRLYRASHETAADEPQLLGRVMAATLLEAGGHEVLETLRRQAG